jgi:hypothetical protein
MIYNYSHICSISLASIIRTKITLNKCISIHVSRSCFLCFKTSFPLLFNMIRHVWLWCLMMHNMHDLQCLNTCVTPGVTRSSNCRHADHPRPVAVLGTSGWHGSVQMHVRQLKSKMHMLARSLGSSSSTKADKS